MLKFLVVDDSVILRKALIEVLKNLGHETIAEAGSGYEAIEAYKNHTPDIVTMDITMPGVQGIKDGVEALKKIREINKDAKVIMVTSHGEEELVMDAIAAGAKGYVLKPVTKDKIEGVLKNSTKVCYTPLKFHIGGSLILDHLKIIGKKICKGK